MSKTNETQTNTAAAKAESGFTKEQLLASAKFRDKADILNALLKSGKNYTVSAVEKMIDTYMKGKVK